MPDERAEAMAVSLAGVPVAVRGVGPWVRKMLAPYALAGDACPEDPVETCVTDADVERERAAVPEYSQANLELIALHRQVAEALPARRRIVFHACVVEYGGRAYAFTAPSGTGKSTHSSLWLRYLGAGARILCGDKPFLAVPEEGPVLVYGSPWMGKEGWGTSGHAPLAGVCVLHQAPENAIGRLDAKAALDPILAQCYIPQDTPSGALAALACVDGLLRRVPVWGLGCTISEEAVRLSFESLTGTSYDDARRAAAEARA